jgi:hypothetical protein
MNDVDRLHRVEDRLDKAEQRLASIETVIEVRKALIDSKRRGEQRAFAIGGLLVGAIALIIRIVSGG